MKSLTFLTILAVAAAVGLSVVGCAPETSTEAAIAYPLDTFIVSDEKIGEDPDMEPYTFVYEGQEITLCCKGCLKTFNKEPEKYLAKLKQFAGPSPTE